MSDNSVLPASLIPILSAVATILSVALTILFAYTRVIARLTRFEVKVNIMWSVLRRKLGLEIRAEDDEEFFK